MMFLAAAWSFCLGCVREAPQGEPIPRSPTAWTQSSEISAHRISHRPESSWATSTQRGGAEALQICALSPPVKLRRPEASRLFVYTRPRRWVRETLFQYMRDRVVDGYQYLSNLAAVSFQFQSSDSPFLRVESEWLVASIHYLCKRPRLAASASGIPGSGLLRKLMATMISPSWITSPQLCQVVTYQSSTDTRDIVVLVQDFQRLLDSSPHCWPRFRVEPLKEVRQTRQDGHPTTRAA
jgi:hypothetical protein